MPPQTLKGIGGTGENESVMAGKETWPAAAGGLILGEHRPGLGVVCREQ